VSFDIEAGIEAVGEVFGRAIEATTGRPLGWMEVLS